MAVAKRALLPTDDAERYPRPEYSTHADESDAAKRRGKGRKRSRGGFPRDARPGCGGRKRAPRPQGTEEDEEDEEENRSLDEDGGKSSMARTARTIVSVSFSMRPTTRRAMPSQGFLPSLYHEGR